MIVSFAEMPFFSKGFSVCFVLLLKFVFLEQP